MAINIDNIEIILNNTLNNAKKVFQAEISGSIRFLAMSFLAILICISLLVLSTLNADSSRRLSSSQNRFKTLMKVAEEYKNLNPQNKSNQNRARNTNQNVDVARIFAEISEKMQLGSRVNRITPDGNNQAIEVNRIYAEELTELETQLALRGVRFLSAEIRALPAGNERLFTISAIIGPHA